MDWTHGGIYEGGELSANNEDFKGNLTNWLNRDTPKTFNFIYFLQQTRSKPLNCLS